MQRLFGLENIEKLERCYKNSFITLGVVGGCLCGSVAITIPEITTALSGDVSIALSSSLLGIVALIGAGILIKQNYPQPMDRS